MPSGRSASITAFATVGTRADCARLARALDAERIGRRRHRVVVQLDAPRLIVGARHGVVHERAGEELAARRRRRTCSPSAWPMPCTMPPCSWPSSSVWLMTRPQSSTAGVAQHLDHAGLGIDLDLGDVRAAGKAHRRAACAPLVSSALPVPLHDFGKATAKGRCPSPGTCPLRTRRRQARPRGPSRPARAPFFDHLVRRRPQARRRATSSSASRPCRRRRAAARRDRSRCSVMRSRVDAEDLRRRSREAPSRAPAPRSPTARRARRRPTRRT